MRTAGWKSANAGNEGGPGASNCSCGACPTAVTEELVNGVRGRSVMAIVRQKATYTRGVTISDGPEWPSCAPCGAISQ